MPPFELVAFDMDGVLVDIRSSWRYIHSFFETDNRDIVQAYMNGNIGSREFIDYDIALWKQAGKHRLDLERLFATIPLMPGTRACVQALHRHHLRTAIVSGGLDILAHRIAAETGIQHVLANGIRGDLESSIVRVLIENKGKALHQLLADLNVTPGRAVAVGNSRYDISMFEVSGLRIAFNPCDNEVTAAADVVITTKDLSQILEYVLA
jgi:phosphoserine phosphatase